MNRRQFSFTLLAGAAGVAGLAASGAFPLAARAQGGQPVEGEQYVRLPQPVPLSDAGKIEVIEFFWYGCPHCNEFEPALEPWVARLPKDSVRFRRVHVGFSGLQAIHQHLFYALDALGLVDTLHAKVFHRFHDERKPLNRFEDAMAWVAGNGVDPQKFRAAWESFSVQTRMRQAATLADQYRIDGVPEVAVQGRFVTGPAMAGSSQECLRVTDYLIDIARKGA
jgi:thiol:disulfide interchange protein DsbA